MLEGLAFKISIDCPSCRAPMPINHVGDAVLCRRCGETMPLPAKLWREHLLERMYVKIALSMEPDTMQPCTMMGTVDGKKIYGRRMPRCNACESTLPLEAIEQAAAGRGQLTCSSCGSAINVRRPPDVVLAQIPGARYIVHETDLGDTAEPNPGAKPLLFPCMGCGAALKVDGTSRTVECEYCQASNYLPDGLWLRLHPAPTAQTFYIVAELDDPS